MRTIAVGRVSFRVDDDKPTFWDRVAAGSWEPQTLALFDRLVGPGGAVLDLGAWVGPLALYAAALGARVAAVEADPAASAELRRNLDANPDLVGRVTIHPCAVAAAAGTVRMAARRKPGDSMSSTLLAGPDGGWTVEARTPASLAAELLADLPAGAPLLIKLDVEGGEYGLLPALRPLLDRPGSALLASFHPAILRESGERDPDGATLAGLHGLRDLPAWAVTADGPAEAEPGPRAIDAHDLWLWGRGLAVRLGRPRASR